jgi:hypothetical protein
MSLKIKPQSRKENIVVQELEGEVLIYDLDENKAFCLNETSALVWQACDGTRTIAEINDFVGKQLSSKVNEDLVWLALDQLSRENLIRSESKIENKFGGLSRREVIKKVGLASVIALPVVTSLVAPLSIHAASSCIAGGTCTCAVTMGTANGEICTTFGGGVPCSDTNCQCQRTNQGNAAGTCVP